ncbi:MAG: alpha-amylase family glycosyl hydrolase [Actinomycetota bacterium]|nr:alpha-amylase family glycosyl hydrolase [Actinomycetota bacterium]
MEVNGEQIDQPVEMQGSDFVAKVPIATGPNHVLAICRSGDGTSAPLIFRGRLQEKPRARITVSVKGDTVTLSGARSVSASPHGSKITRYTWTPDARHPSRLTTTTGKAFTKVTGPRLRLHAPIDQGEYYVSLKVTDAKGRSDASITYFVVDKGQARPVDMAHEHPSWIDKAVIYAPIPQLWGEEGPTTVRRRLPYLRDLGVDVLWLWPPTSLRSFGEEYAIDDFFKIDPSWGPKAAFEEMIDEAHRQNMHVIVDFVPNHLSAKSPYFKDAKKYGKSSPYFDFFDRNSQGKPTHYFDWSHLPNLNYSNPEVRTMVTEATAYWVGDLHVDGFRMDVAWGVKKRRPGFWTAWRRELKRINPDLLLLAEASAVDPYYFANGFDAAYDWTRQLGHWAWSSAFTFPEEAGALLAPLIDNGQKGFSPGSIVMRFLNNNDTGVRFIDQYGVDMSKTAATLQFTVPGIPALFAGDEIGASYQPYSNLTPIAWRDRYGLRTFYKKLIDLKHNLPALNSSKIEILTASPNSALAFVRPAVGKSGPVLVVLNFAGKSRVEVSGSPVLTSLLDSSDGAMRDLLTDDRVKMKIRGGSASIAMPAESSLVLTPVDR